MELTHTDVDRLLSRLGPEGGALYLPGDLDPEALDELLDARYGTARTLVSDGAADPAADASRGGALLVPFEGRAVSMRAWAYGDRWVGSGTARDAAGVERPVLAAARREVSIPPRGEDVDWVERLVAITGWTEPARRRDAAWAETESRLGTALPSDYKRIVDTFGAGAFDGYLGLNQEPWTHYREEGLLIWAGTEHEDLYCWATDGEDPDRWSVVVRSSDGEDVPFDRPTAEFVCRILLDPHHRFTMARYFDTHWFMSHG
ncbi:hypothetical protein [Streptomyces hydrogenans]|uniref:hypothetical protein n=1 Tax=Streptomyces hydrogenans TaxID=1873719 RepID=UPI0033B2A0B2